MSPSGSRAPPSSVPVCIMGILYPSGAAFLVSAKRRGEESRGSIGGCCLWGGMLCPARKGPVGRRTGGRRTCDRILWRSPAGGGRFSRLTVDEGGSTTIRGKARRGFAALTMMAALAAGATTAGAYDSKGTYKIVGIGGIACKDFAAQIKKDKQVAIVADAWIAGYMTAANRAQPKTYSLSPVIQAFPILVRVAGACE